MKILLISLNQKDVDEFKKAPTDISALGVRYLSSYLKSKGHNVKILFLAKPFGKAENRRELEQINKLIARLNPGLVGVSLMSNHFFRAREITKHIQKKFSLPVIWGGIHPTIQPENSLQYADMVCVGEGELAMESLAIRLDTGLEGVDIEGIWYKKKDQIIKKGTAPLLKKIENIPYPDYDFGDHYIIDEYKLVPLTTGIYQQYYPASNGDHRLISSRGCPHACAYCCNSVFRNLYGGHFMRLRSVGSIINEMIAVKNEMPFVKSFKIMDDSFMVNSTQWIKEFALEYKDKVDLPFFCLVSPLTVNEEKLTALVDSGLRVVQMGLQSGSDRVNQEFYLRHISQDRFLSAARLLQEYKGKLNVVIDVIVDNPYETDEDSLETIKVLNTLEKPFNLAIFSLSFYPGTHLYNRAIDNNILKNHQEYLDKQFHLLKNNYLSQVIYLIPRLGKTKVEKLARNRRGIINKLQVYFLFFLYRNKNKVPYWVIKYLSKLKKYVTS